MDARTRRLLAVAGGALMLLAGAMIARPAPALAQALPNWQGPGTTYANIWSSPGFTGLLPTTRPTDAAQPQPQPRLLQPQAASAHQVVGVGFGPMPQGQPALSTAVSYGQGSLGQPSVVAGVGEYCADASGGSIYVPAGAPTDGLTCPAPDSGS